MLTRYEAAAMAGAALAGNLVWRRWDRSGRFFRAGESLTGGIILYPLSILLVILWLPYPSAALAVWAVLAVGDVVASILGRAIGGPKLPGAKSKTYAGSLSFFLFGFPAAYGLLCYGGTLSDQALWLAGAATVGGALAEGISCGLGISKPYDNDNLRVVVGASLGFMIAWSTKTVWM